MRKRRILAKKFPIFRHSPWKRLMIMIQGHKIWSKSCNLCFKASYQIWSWLEHVLWLNYVLFENSKISSESIKNHFLRNYATYALAYYSAPVSDRIMIHTSFECAQSYEENEGSMNKIGWEIKAGGWIKDDNYQKKHPVFYYIFGLVRVKV